MSQDSTAAAAPLPTLHWIGRHVCVQVRDRYACVRCGTTRPGVGCCEPGMVVHLVDPADVHEDPLTFDGLFYAEPEAIAAAHRRWADDGYTVVRKPTRFSPDAQHPRFRPCPTCNTALIAAGQLGLPRLPATVDGRR